MKLLFCLLAVLSLSVSQLAAQPRWNTAIKAGAGWTGIWQTQDYPYPYQTKGTKEHVMPNTGVQIGTQVSYRVSRHFGLDIGLEYQTMKDKYQLSYNDGTQFWHKTSPETYNTAQRIQLPFRVRYQFTGNPRSPYLIAGVMAGYLRNVERDYTGYRKYTIPFDVNDKQLIHGPFTRKQFPLLVGVGVSVGRHVALELVYQYMNRPMEFLDLAPRSVGPDIPTSASYMNQGLFLSASYRFKKIY